MNLSIVAKGSQAGRGREGGRHGQTWTRVNFQVHAKKKTVINKRVFEVGLVTALCVRVCTYMGMDGMAGDEFGGKKEMKDAHMTTTTTISSWGNLGQVAKFKRQLKTMTLLLNKAIG